MGLRTALENSRILTFAVVSAFVWLLLTALRVAESFDWLAVGAGNFIGRNALGGIAGLVVLLVVLGALLTLYSELSESDPAPDSWPPSE